MDDKVLVRRVQQLVDANQSLRARLPASYWDNFMISSTEVSVCCLHVAHMLTCTQGYSLANFVDLYQDVSNRREFYSRLTGGRSASTLIPVQRSLSAF